MLKSKLIRFFFYTTGALLIAILYFSPNIVSKTSQYFPAIYGSDEAFYMYRLSAALHGDKNLSCMQDPSLATATTFYPYHLEQLWASILKPFTGLNIFTAFKTSYFVLPAIFFILLMASLEILSSSTVLAFTIATWGMLESGTFYWKLFKFDEKDLIFPFLRYVNPMLLAIPLLIALSLVLDSFNSNFNNRNRYKVFLWYLSILLSTIAIFYSQLFYWSWFFATIIIFSAISYLQNDFKNIKPILFIFLICIPLTILQLYSSHSITSQPLFLSVIHRTGVLIANRHPYFLLHKGILFTFFLYQWICRKQRNINWRLLSSGIIAGYILLNQNLITGLSNQDHHFFRPMNILYILVVTDIVSRILKNITSNQLKLAKIILILLIPIFSFNLVQRYRHLINQIEYSGAHGQYAKNLNKSINTLRSLAISSKGSLLVPQEPSYVIGIMADIPIYVHDYTNGCIFADEELFARWAFLKRAYGVTNENYSKWITPLHNYTDELPWWLYGIPDTYSGSRSIFQLKERQAIAKASVESYSSRSLDSFARELNEKHGLPKYALSGPDFNLDIKELENVFEMKLIANFTDEKVQIWKLIYTPHHL